jgi:cobalt-zinc-cadmium efflux system membrane fusion protein
MSIDKNFLTAFACTVLLIGCSDQSTEREEAHDDSHDQAGRISLSTEAYEAAGIAIAPVSFRKHVPTIRVTGTLSYDERRMAIATARIGGRITRVVADFGQSVSNGETLAWIDSPELGAAQADYLRAESMSRLRKAEYERAQLLLEGEAISQGELLRREAEWRAAEAELTTAEQKLHILGLSQLDIDNLSNDRANAGHEYPVRAPIHGRVTERKAVQGRVVSANDELFTVARLESLWLFLQVFEKDLPAVMEGAAVTLTCESHPDHRFTGTVDFVGQVLDPHSRTVQARVVIENPDGKLKPGMFVYASIDAGNEDGHQATRLAIPVSAVAKVDGRDVVFVQTAGRTFELRPVVLGEATEDWVEIRSGLTEGEMIAVEGAFTLKSEILKGGLEEHDH